VGDEKLANGALFARLSEVTRRPSMPPRFLLLAALFPTLALAEASSRDGNLDAPPSTPEQERAMFHLPPGFEIQLVAAEPEIQKPMNLNFDTEGRLWVTGSELYPWPAKVDALGQPVPGFAETWSKMAGAFDAKKAPPPPEKATDTLRVLSQFGSDGRAGKIDGFADGLNIPIGVQPLPRPAGAKGDSVIVFSIPKIWRFTDTDGDGRADLREPLYGDFGFRDTHGMSSNYLYHADGWIYGCHGFANHSVVRDGSGQVTEMNSGNTYRFRPDGSRFEIYTHGQTNPFGLAVDDDGNFYSADSHSRPVMMLIPGAYYEGIGKTHDGLGFAPRIMEHNHGSSAIAGVAWYGARQFPAEYYGNTFNGNPVTRRINRDRYEWHGSTPQAIEMPDFLTCDDPWFRPVQVKLGPDGALWIADFYTPIIGHYEQPLADPRRDHSHGRIWRIVYRGEKLASSVPAIPNLAALDTKSLSEKLSDPNLVIKTLATHELAGRSDFDPEPFLHEGAPEFGRWVCERVGAFDNLEILLRHSTAQLSNIAAGRTGLTRGDPILKAMVGYSVGSADPKVRRAAVQALARNPLPDHIGMLLWAWAHTEGPQDLAGVHSVRIALKEALSAPGGFAEARKEKQFPYAENPERLEDVSLAISSADSASFLLAYLRQVNFTAPRSGEYLRHVIRNLPEAELETVSALVLSLSEKTSPQQFVLAEAIDAAARERGWRPPPQLGAWTQQKILAALETSDAALCGRAIAALRDANWPEKFAPLERVVQNKNFEANRRVAALEAAFNQEAGPALAARVLADPASLPLRKKAAELLGRTESETNRQRLANALSAAPTELALQITASLAKTDDGCAALLDLIEAGKASPTPLQNRLIGLLLMQRSEALQARVAAVTKDLPPEDARLDQVITERVKSFGPTRADPTKGAQVFAQFCAVCHRFRGQGGNVGPNLDGVVARGAHRLIEDILDPNRNVDPTFRQTTIETNDGRTLLGVNFREEGGNVLLTDPAGQTQTVAKAAVKAQTASRLSLMPPAFESAIPPEDFNALLSYLLEQR